MTVDEAAAQCPGKGSSAAGADFFEDTRRDIPEGHKGYLVCFCQQADSRRWLRRGPSNTAPAKPRPMAVFIFLLDSVF